MDGLPANAIPRLSALSLDEAEQHTIGKAIACIGTGLHSGRPVSVRLLPAGVDTGIVFRRVDLGMDIPARFDAVVDTRLCTVLGAGEARVGTVEHLMAALAGTGVDNALVEVDGPEIPVLDGSAEPWTFLLRCAGLRAQGAARRMIEVLRPVRVEHGDAFAELRPHGYSRGGFDLAMTIEFKAAAIGRQAFGLSLDPQSFGRDLARARTFVQRHEIEGLQAAGLARGGSLDNAIVVDGDQVLNPAGLRMRNEFVRHKLLDAVGDLALAGGPLQARFIGAKSGHALNNQLLRAVFADRLNWRVAPRTEALLAA